MRHLDPAARFPIALALLAIVAGCNGEPSPAQSEAAAQAATPVRIAVVESTQAEDRVRAVGTLGPRDEVRLSFKVGGIVERLSVEAGDSVRRGQSLATLRQAEVDASLRQAAESVAKARRDLDRGRRLRADEVATEEQVQDLETAYNVAQAAESAARFNARFARIEAPVDGLVLERHAEPDELVQAGQTVLVVGATGAGWVVRVALADRDVVRVKDGDAATLRFDAFPGQRFDGTVRRIAPAADPRTGTFEVEVEVRPAAGTRFVRGLVAQAELLLPPAEGVAGRAVVPVTALVDAEGSTAQVFVFDAQAGVARRKQVSIGALLGDRVEVLAGLEAGEQVITDGAAWLTDGRAVRLVDDRG
jgi:RND family efflux transporter MFP subunit